jgi:DNA-binding transcriptional regulator YiaG
MQSAPESIPSVSATGSAFSVRWNNAFLTAVFLVGTGGTATPRTINYIPSGPQQVKVSCGADTATDSHRMLDSQEKLAGIRRYLSLSVTDLAKVLHVGRPTVYSWLRDEANLRVEHARRLESIYGLARKWKTMSSRPVGAFLNRPVASGSTLMALLSAKPLDSLEVETAYTQIQQAMGREPRHRSATYVAKQRGFKLATTQQRTSWSSAEDLDV